MAMFASHSFDLCINGHVALRVPVKVIKNKCALYIQQGKAHHRAELLNDDDFTIIDRYQSEYRGFVQYYFLAQNVSWLWRLHWVMRESLLKTLAHKHRSTVSKMARKYRAIIETPHGQMKCLEKVVLREGKKPLVARFGGIPLRRQTLVTLTNQLVPLRKKPARNELLKRLLADTCELCKSTHQVEVHHIRKLADLQKPGRVDKPQWIRVMAARQRKTLIVCRECHQAIHAGKPTRKSPGQQ